MEENKTEQTEVITSQTVADPQGQSVQQEAVTEQAVGTQIPEKWVGKKFEDVVAAYSEVEKEKGRLADEVGSHRKKVEELEQRLQQALSQPSPQPVATQKEKTPEELYEEEWQVDPKQAALNYTKRTQEVAEQKNLAMQTVQYYQAAKSGQLKGWEDFNELEPTMTNIAQRYAGLVNPKYLNSPQMLEVLYLMARGSTLDARLEKERAKVASNQDVIAKKKAAAFSESPSTSTQGTVDMNSLSLEELSKILPRANRVE